MSSNIPPQTKNIIEFENLKYEASLVDVLKIFEEGIRCRLNCVRVGIISEYNAETRVSKVNIVNKITLSQNSDGTQMVQNYAPVYCKTWFFGWGNVGITHPVLEGQECIILINDRELESWFINGGINQLKYNRNHNFSDSICLVGLTSVPNMTATLQNCLNIFWGLNNIQLSESGINLNAQTETGFTVTAPVNITGGTNITGNTNITGDTIINGNLTVNGNISTTGTISASGNISSQADVIAGGISLKNHTHLDAESRSTTPPQG